MIQDTVVIGGECSLETRIEGDCDLTSMVEGDPDVLVVEGGGQTYPHYQGDYTVTPSTTAQVLDTDGKVMDDDVTVQAVQAGSATTPATIITADPTISVSSGGLITAQVSKTQQITPTVQEGYVETGTPGNVGVSGSNTEQLSTQGAQTIHPASTDQTIASGKYLTGAQTFKAVTVSGLTADKVLQGNVIKIGDADDDDSIMSVTGTAQGGITPTGTKQINIASNGTTTEDVTNYASAEITTNVPASAVDTGTKSISSNGTHDVVGYASASVNVPNSYLASDEGKVVSNGALVAQTSDTVTANDTYDTTLINSLTVNVSGGGGISIDDIVTETGITGAIRITEATSTFSYALAYRTNITSVYCDSITSIPSYWLRSCTGLQTLVLPVTTSIAQQFVHSCTALKKVDLGALGNLVTNLFYTNTQSLDTLILRKSNSIVTLANVNAFAGTPFASGGTGGTIYIPKVLYDHLGDGTALDYQSATNWSTIYGYGTITWAKIEGSIYENAYADGTPISS